MLNITVNKDKIFEYKEENGKKVLNGEIVDADIRLIGEEQYHILYQGRSYSIELVGADAEKMFMKINGKVVGIEVKDRNRLILEKMGLLTASSTKIREVKSPMPGLIIDVKVKEGDTVQAGDPLIVLEAMKMENVIRASGDGIIQSIVIQKGTIVEKNTLLIKFC